MRKLSPHSGGNVRKTDIRPVMKIVQTTAARVRACSLALPLYGSDIFRNPDLQQRSLQWLWRDPHWKFDGVGVILIL